MHFEIAIEASQGERRSQEDTALAWPAPGVPPSATLLTLPEAVPGHAVAVLCDGMGGHAGGSLASRLASESFLLDFIGSEGSVRQRLYDALEKSNASIADHVQQSPAFAGMGSTLIGVHLDAEGLQWISVGDSLLYLWRDGALLQLNEDHSLAPEIDKLAQCGKITWDAAHNDPRRHYLRSALTGDEIEMIDLSERAAPLMPGDVVLVASDGINSIEPEVISGVIAGATRESARRITGSLLRAVEAAGQPHQDNTTIVAIRVCKPAAA